MNAALAVAWEVENMSVEERVVKIESDMGHVRSTLTDVKDEVKSLRGELKGEIQEVRTEVRSFKTEVAKEFASVRGELQSFKADVAKEFGDAKTETAQQFGLVRTDLEKLRTAIEGTKVWFLLTCFGAVFSGIGAVVGLHALKLF
jgi:chromosome segregation ATPase